MKDEPVLTHTIIEQLGKLRTNQPVREKLNAMKDMVDAFKHQIQQKPTKRTGWFFPFSSTQISPAYYEDYLKHALHSKKNVLSKIPDDTTLNASQRKEKKHLLDSYTKSYVRLYNVKLHDIYNTALKQYEESIKHNKDSQATLWLTLAQRVYNEHHTDALHTQPHGNIPFSKDSTYKQTVQNIEHFKKLALQQQEKEH